MPPARSQGISPKASAIALRVSGPNLVAVCRTATYDGSRIFLHAEFIYLRTTNSPNSVTWKQALARYAYNVALKCQTSMSLR